jgi:hypothetical protein
MEGDSTARVEKIIEDKKNMWNRFHGLEYYPAPDRIVGEE